MGLINAKWKGSQVSQDSSNRMVSDTEKNTWNNKANSSHSHSISNVTNLQITMCMISRSLSI